MASTSLNLFSLYFANKQRRSYTTVNLPGNAGNGNFFTKISRVSADREISAAWTCTKLWLEVTVNNELELWRTKWISITPCYKLWCKTRILLKKFFYFPDQKTRRALDVVHTLNCPTSDFFSWCCKPGLLTRVGDSWVDSSLESIQRHIKLKHPDFVLSIANVRQR